MGQDSLNRMLVTVSMVIPAYGYALNVCLLFH